METQRSINLATAAITLKVIAKLQQKSDIGFYFENEIQDVLSGVLKESLLTLSKKNYKRVEHAKKANRGIIAHYEKILERRNALIEKMLHEKHNR